MPSRHASLSPGTLQSRQIVIFYVTCDVQIRGSTKLEYRITNAQHCVKDLRISEDRRRDHIN